MTLDKSGFYGNYLSQQNYVFNFIKKELFFVVDQKSVFHCQDW